MRPSDVWLAFIAAWEADDRDAARGFIADDCVAVDHRPLGFGELHGGDALLAYLNGIRELVPGARAEERERLGESEHAAVSIVTLTGGEDGAPVGLEYHLVSEVRDGLVRRVWYFPIEAREEALRAFAAL